MADELRTKLHGRVDKLCDDLVYTAPEVWPEKVNAHLVVIVADIQDAHAGAHIPETE